jgi:hypothetical protein
MMSGVDHRVVVNYDNSVARRVYIELDGVGSELNGALECSE